jgi:hypothetical protein
MGRVVDAKLPLFEIGSFRGLEFALVGRPPADPILDVRTAVKEIREVGF